MHKFLLSVFSLVPWLTTVTSAAAADDFLTKVADGVYVHRGQHADIDVPARGDSANLGVVVGTRCVAVIDSGGSIVTGRALSAAIALLTDKPVCYVINTHVHFDHVLGNAAFVGPGTEFIGQAQLPEALAVSREFFAESFAAELGGEGQGGQVIAPTRQVTDSERIDLGGRHLLLQAVASAHTATDMTVLDERTNTLFSGDLVFRERLPVLDGDLEGWLAWLERTSSQTYARVVPGHGPVDEAWPAGAAPLQRYLRALLDQTRAAIAEGVFIEDAKHTVAEDERAHWLLTERAHGLNVSRAFRALEWE
jgi:quinoprotein relay system zinc metallohydrolase 2